jgi:aspartate aminotransferase-like enzyme
LAVFSGVLKETEEYGFETVQKDIWDLGNSVREELEKRGFKSVAAPGYKSPGMLQGKK